MDSINEVILDELRSDSKFKLKKLARKINMPMSTIYARIKKMETEGIIRNYSIDVDWKKIGYSVCAYVLVYVDTTKLKELKQTQPHIVSQIRKFAFVDEANIITGEADIIIKMRAKNTEDLGRLLTDKIQGIAGINNTKTLIVLS